MRIALSLVLCLVITAPQGLSGQQQVASRVVPGARVRVWTQGEQYSGTLTALSNDSVWLTSDGSVVLARSAVERVDVSVGRQGHTLLGLGVGFGGGLLGGAAVASVAGQDGGFDPGQLGAGTWAGLTVIGGVVGALTRSDRWVRVADWSPVPTAKPGRVGHPNLAGIP